MAADREAPQDSLPFNSYRGMWVIALFDLPVKSKSQKREYVKFRRLLLKMGFIQLQYSVYGYYCLGADGNEAKRRAIRTRLPPQGQVRLVSVTDRQFAQMECYLGNSAADPEVPIGQTLLF